ncbi:MAG: ATP-dependent transcriptional regulator, MalT-like, LuxR family [Actinomycetia bacterium]|nr:ATP-dependent transcriptional regulator, MalT-like, LuxR family [Actinomycetes bacterium]
MRGAPTRVASAEARVARYNGKLAAPRPSAAIIERARLLETLADNRAPLILLSAPPGFGKTSLAAMWVASRAAPRAAWVTVDADDNSGGRFWHAVNAALAAAVDGSGETFEPDSSAPPAEIALETASRADRPLILVLDDFHELRDDAALHQFDVFRRYTPPLLQVMLVTRVDPRLPLQRLRMEGRMTELRAAELAFTRDETAALLAGIDGIGPAEIDELHACTEGWPAALRFVVLALKAAPDPRRFVRQFAGDDRALADYLLTEVVASHPPEVHDFLLRTSIPDQLTPSLARQLAPGVDADALLIELEKENLFVSEIAGGPHGYRYHNLFRGFLRMEAARELGTEVAELHRTSANWCAATGDYLAALRHAVAGGDWSLAGEIVLDNWRALFLVETQAVVAAIVAGIGSAPLREQPELALLAAAALLSSGELQSAERCILAAGDAFAERDERQPDLESLRTMCLSSAARLRGDTSAAAASARTLLTLAPSTRLTQDVIRRQQKTLALHALAAAELESAELEEAEEHLEQVLELAQEQGADTVALRSLARLALLEAVRGRLQHSEARAEEALAFAAARCRSDEPQVVSAHNALAWVMYEWNELQAAADHASLALQASRRLGDRFEEVFATHVSALVDAAAGPRGVGRGLRRLRGLAAELDGWQTPRLLQLLFAASEARLLAARGGTVEAWRALGDEPGLDETLLAGAVRARLHLQEGHPWEAVDALAPGIELSATSEDIPGAIEASLLEALARAELRDREGSSRALERALHLAAPHRHRRVFLEGGPTIRQMLLDHIRTGTGNRSFLGDLLEIFDNGAPRPAVGQLLEPLSEREVAVLSYLPTMLSNQEIASELFVSVNTVKTHLRSIYRKLGTSKRRDAVAAARARDLI